MKISLIGKGSLLIPNLFPVSTQLKGLSTSSSKSRGAAKTWLSCTLSLMLAITNTIRAMLIWTRWCRRPRNRSSIQFRSNLSSIKVPSKSRWGELLRSNEYLWKWSSLPQVICYSRNVSNSSACRLKHGINTIKNLSSLKRVTMAN